MEEILLGPRAQEQSVNCPGAIASGGEGLGEGPSRSQGSAGEGAVFSAEPEAHPVHCCSLPQAGLQASEAIGEQLQREGRRLGAAFYKELGEWPC